MGRLLARVAATDPAAGVCKLPQPFRMIDKLLSGIIDDATNLALERERRRLAAQGIVEGTQVRCPPPSPPRVNDTAKSTRRRARRPSPEPLRPPLTPNFVPNFVVSVQVFLPSAVADDVGAVACLAASEDGRRAFAGVEDGSVVVVDAATGVVASRVVAFSDKPVLAVDVVTARPPPPDDPFWHARGGRHADEGEAPPGRKAPAPTKAPTKAPPTKAPRRRRRC